jgi:NTP pyrophosphatase (non-canonical NTP hydrolase)
VSTVEQAIAEICEELTRAEAKHPSWPEDVIHGAAILAEEAGEVIQAAIDVHYYGRSLHELRRELVQVGAMAVRNLIHLERTSP